MLVCYARGVRSLVRAADGLHSAAGRLAAAALLLVVLVAAPAHARKPVLHEYIEPNAAEDVELETTTLDGTMPAAMDTPSGVVQAPKQQRSQAPSEKAYSGSSPSSMDATYQIDSDTRQPDVVQYDDPFSPAVTPFKRLYAYDAVSDGLELVVQNKDLVKIEIGGNVEPGDDAFYGDMFVDVDKDVPVRIPSVGPGSRVLAAHVEPPAEFTLLRDGADNWYLKMGQRARVRLVVRLAIDRRVFGSSFGATSWSRLGTRAPSLPVGARAAARDVIEHIGVSRAMPPRDAVSRLVSYFRGFAPSEVRPTSRGVKLYTDLAFSQRGVCRHRSYAFVITALELGIPTRMVRNEAHAWVEVWDGEIWHRIDLGGAAGRLEAPPDDGRPHHVLPDDPYSWPEGSDSGLEMAERRRSASGASGSQGAQGTTPGPGPGDGGASPSSIPIGPADAPDGGAGEEEERRPASELTLDVEQGSRLFRGNPLSIAGKVVADGDPCGYARVDVSLDDGTGKLRRIGSLASDEDGRYSGQVVIPLDTDVGEYDVVVSTPGDARCGVGETR